MRGVALLLTAALLLAADKPTFPALQASNLNGQEMQLPSALAGDLNLVLIAFQRGQQKNVDTWLAHLPKIQQAHPKFAYYELPVISRLNAVTRWFIDNGMRSGIPDKAQRARTITLYIDKQPFRNALALPSEDRIYALLLNKQGEVVWRAEGDYTEESGRSLTDFLSR
jgi:hypothetical protein